MSRGDSSPHYSNSYPAAYPSPSMSGMSAGQYSFPPLPEGQQVNSPAGTNMALPSLNLPPIRAMDGRPQLQQQPQQAQSHQQQQQASPQPAQMGPQMQYYSGHPFPSQSSDLNQHLRYPIPPNTEGRIMSGGRHKKEIKRRTKTGCLTCRKRRIKCDEAHPACRNCQKSKRECLGYDPIFKSQPGPAAIQPAMSAAANMSNSSPNTVSYPPHGYVSAGAHGYGPPANGTENAASELYNYGAAIDPALGGVGTPCHRDAGMDSAYSTDVIDQNGHPAKRTKIEELLCVNGYPPPPPAPPAPIHAARQEEIRHIYMTVYAPGIDKFLETRWFGLRGLTHLFKNNRLCDQFSMLIRRFSLDAQYPSYNNSHDITYSLEATLVWAMMGMCTKTKGSDQANAKVDELDEKDGIDDAAKRFKIWEALVTGEYLEPESAPALEAKANGKPFPDQLKTRENDFWKHVHTFLTIRDNEASTAKEIDDTLASCRSLLDSRENRDVIYSVMIARHVGARVAEFPDNMQQPKTNDEQDAKTKLHVATKFIEDQAGGKGTNQVVTRMCNIASRSWAIKKPS